MRALVRERKWMDFWSRPAMRSISSWMAVDIPKNDIWSVLLLLLITGEPLSDGGKSGRSQQMFIFQCRVLYSLGNDPFPEPHFPRRRRAWGRLCRGTLKAAEILSGKGSGRYFRRFDCRCLGGH